VDTDFRSFICLAKRLTKKMPARQLVATASLINITVVEEPMKYLSKLFATALVSLLAIGGVAQAHRERVLVKRAEPVVCLDWSLSLFQQTHLCLT
jgi:hypothetical protein